MKELEDNILYKLATAQGDITEDVELIEGLESTKKIGFYFFLNALILFISSYAVNILQHILPFNNFISATEIGIKQVAATNTQALIKITSEKYRSVANRSSLLFFFMNDLVKIHTYYIYSLEAFTQVFYRGIDLVPLVRAPKSEDAPEADTLDLTDAELADRCSVLINSITGTVFSYIRRGVFEVDKLTVSTLLTLRIAVNDGKLTQEEVDYLVVGNISTDPGNMGPLHEWLPPSIWPKVKALEGLKRFSNIGDNMQSDSDFWQSWFDNETPESTKLPGDYQKTLNNFDRLILLRAMRPDRVTTALRLVIKKYIY